MTLRANESWTATSSAVVARTVRPSSARACPTPVCTCPNAPKSTFAIERFIAFAISSVSSVPEAPTSIPATMRTVESSTKPVAEAARPVNAFRSEITTGMSAPPIGSTNITPKTSARRMSATIAHCSSSPATIATPSAAAAPRTSDVHDVLAREDDRAAADELLQLREGDERAGERDRADQRGERDRQRLVPDEHAVELVELGERDERRRTAADPVEQGHHLRHRGHLHPPRADDARRRCRSPPRRRSAPSSRSRR